MTTENGVEMLFNKYDEDEIQRIENERVQRKMEEFLTQIHNFAIAEISDTLLYDFSAEPLHLESRQSRDDYRKTFKRIFDHQEISGVSLLGELAPTIKMRIIEIKRSERIRDELIMASYEHLLIPTIDMTLKVDKKSIPEDINITVEKIKEIEFPYTEDDLKRYISENSINLEDQPARLFGYLIDAIEQIDSIKSLSEDNNQQVLR